MLSFNGLMLDFYLAFDVKNECVMFSLLFRLC